MTTVSAGERNRSLGPFWQADWSKDLQSNCCCFWDVLSFAQPTDSRVRVDDQFFWSHDRSDLDSHNPTQQIRAQQMLTHLNVHVRPLTSVTNGWHARQSVGHVVRS